MTNITRKPAKVKAQAPKSALKASPDVPKVPSGLSAAARVEWGRVIGTLGQMELLELTDPAMLQAYITSFDRWKKAESKVRKQGAVIREVLRDRNMNVVGGKDVPSPWVKIARDSEATCLRLLKQMKLDTASRLKAQPPKLTESDIEALRTRAWELFLREDELLAQRDAEWRTRGSNPWADGDPPAWVALQKEIAKVDALIAQQGL
jgi:P27 family predicted phage terminase small subunit